MLSQTAEYALRAVLTIAAAGEDHPIGAARLAAELGIPQNYLSKTLHLLCRAGVLDSTRGKFGGFRLARPATAITLLEVVRPFDEISSGRACLLGLPVCSDQTPCAAHRKWKQVSERVAAFFRETTVADLTPRRG
ncbi:MAG TPA: Rrf2 family transcriptional regulator [Gemmatimonadales bacterium]|nr:Rrf2 family transcriptional regulator [Gemmatimonadales bacterium]